MRRRSAVAPFRRPAGRLRARNPLRKRRTSLSKGLTSNLRCNEQIRISPVRVINEHNDQIGVVDNREALRMAREAGLDLVEVAPNERPPVCKIMDYGKFKYEQKKKVRKHHEQQLKEVRLRPKTDDHDRDIKVARAQEFLRKGDKVQFKMVFRGRERAHREIGMETFREILDHFGELVKIERPPGMDGRDMIMVLGPNKQAFDRLKVQKAEPPAATPQTPAQPQARSADAGAVDAPPDPAPEPGSQAAARA
ncbi:MAG TPA: translation initiation factor IF-3 [Phycisphaerae bacterium]|nr:translation initiation factor IF-3 [Phycisphaerae bacterium]